MCIIVIHHYKSVTRSEVANDIPIVNIFVTERDHAEILEIALQWFSAGVVTK